LYKTQVERDWAYIAKREFNYDVRLRTLGYSSVTGLFSCSVGMFLMKRAVFWPFFAVTPVAAAFFYPRFFTLHNKKLFDMCNVGEEYYLGSQRNFVLRKCNEILDREDF
jgi:hypothetical protein